MLNTKFKRNLTSILVLSLILSTEIRAQEGRVVASTGRFASNTEGSLSFTVGEAIVDLGSSGSHFLTQGFQQPSANVAIAIELGDFWLSQGNSAVRLQWYTLSERNSLRFEVEKSRDGLVFKKIGELKSAGNTSVRQNYVFDDNDPFTGLNYYRIKEIGTDNQVFVSKVLSADFGKKHAKNAIQALPNVFSNGFEVIVDLTEVGTIDVYNATGVLVSSQKLGEASGSKLRIEAAHWPAGMYFVQLNTPTEKAVVKVVKQ